MGENGQESSAVDDDSGSAPTTSAFTGAGEENADEGPSSAPDMSRPNLPTASAGGMKEGAMGTKDSFGKNKGEAKKGREMSRGRAILTG